MKTRQITTFFHLLFEPQLFRKLIVPFGNCQNSFSWDPPFCCIRKINVHKILENYYVTSQDNYWNHP